MGPAFVGGLREKPTMAQARPTTGVLATPVASGRLQVIGAGKPLEPGIRRAMEVFFQADFSGVRVHEGLAAQAMGALAFTLGEEIHFAPGQYDPGSREGSELIGHELAHVVQQREGRVANPYGTGVAIVQDPELEAEADRLGREIADRVWSRPRVGQTATGTGWPGQLREPVMQAMKRKQRFRRLSDNKRFKTTVAPGSPTTKFTSPVPPHTSSNTKQRAPVRFEKDEVDEIEDFDEDPPVFSKPPSTSKSEIDEIEDFDEDPPVSSQFLSISKSVINEIEDFGDIDIFTSTSTKSSKQNNIAGKECSWVRLSSPCSRQGYTYWSCSSQGNAASLRDVLRFVLEQKLAIEELKTTAELGTIDRHGYIWGMFRHLQRIQRYPKEATFESLYSPGDVSPPSKNKIVIDYNDRRARWAWSNQAVTSPGVNINESENQSHLHRLYIYTLFAVIQARSFMQNAPVAAMLVDGTTGKVMGIALKSWTKAAYHAEINLIELAWTDIQNPILYVTMIPCDMCRGRINEMMGNKGSVVYLQYDPGIKTELKPKNYYLDNPDLNLKSPVFSFNEYKQKTKDALEQQNTRTLNKLTSPEGKDVIKRTELSWKSKIEKYTLRSEGSWNRPDVGKVTLYLDAILQSIPR